MTNENKYQKTAPLAEDNNIVTRTYPREPLTPEEGGYEVIPPGDLRIKEIEEFNRQLRPGLYAQLDKKRPNHQNKSADWSV